MNVSSIPNRAMKTKLGFAAAMLAASLLGHPSAHAANATWNNVSGNTDFNTGSNWTGGTGTGGMPGTADNAQFGSAVVAQPNLSSALSIVGLTFLSTSSGYDLTSGSSNTVKLTLTSAGGAGAGCAVYGQGAASTTNTIDAALGLGAGVGASQTIAQSGGGTLVINGVISGNNPTSLTFQTSSGGFMTPMQRSPARMALP